MQARGPGGPKAIVLFVFVVLDFRSFVKRKYGTYYENHSWYVNMKLALEGTKGKRNARG
jgi:hypothetical protein